MITAEKTCFRCGVIKPLSEFYKHKMMADGYLNKCKACTKSDVKQNRSEKIDYYRTYDRERSVDPHRKANMSRVVRKYRSVFKERMAANNAVARALLSGVLTKPCACWHCGSTMGIVGHHPDYSNQLGVSWMCQACHKQVHQSTDDILSGCLTTQLQPT